MAKYLLVIALVFVCSSFNICERKVITDGTISRVYIYPDCGDTSCYLKQRYQANHVVEYLYINSELRYKRILDKTSSWIANVYTFTKDSSQHRVDTIAGNLPDYSFAINDSCSLNVEYFADGAYHICTYGYNRANECRHTDSYSSTIVFDSLYKSKMMGSLQIICDTNSVTDAYTNEEFVKIVHRERQIGMWRTFDLKNYKTDSAYYDPKNEK